MDSAHDVEMEDVSVTASAIANARVTATVSLKQHGYRRPESNAHRARRRQDTRRARDHACPNGASRPNRFSFPLERLAQRVLRSRRATGRRREPEQQRHDAAILVSDAKRRILYVEGEPRWEYKFIRRAEDDDPTVQIVSMLRTSENKIYRQGISDPSELADGFRCARKISSVMRASSSAQSMPTTSLHCSRNCCANIVDRRGGGILFLGGRSSLSDGGWGASSLNDLLPTFFPAAITISIATRRQWS